MKPLLFLTLLHVLCTANVAAQWFEQYQYFEAVSVPGPTYLKVDITPSFQNIWQVGKPQKAMFNKAATVPNVIVTDTINYYPANNISSFIVTADFSSANTIPQLFALKLQWKQKLDIDINNDGGKVEFSLDSGVTWRNAFTDTNVLNFYGFSSNNVDTLSTGEMAFTGTDTSWRDIWLCLNYFKLQTPPQHILYKFTLTSDATNFNKEGWMIDNMTCSPTIGHTLRKVQEESAFIIAPNPASSYVYVETKNHTKHSKILTMELLNSAGQTIDKWINLPSNYRLETSKYAEGKYFLKIRVEGKTEKNPFMISRQ
jgi:hypothetical protein